MIILGIENVRMHDSVTVPVRDLVMGLCRCVTTGRGGVVHRVDSNFSSLRRLIAATRL